MELYLNGSYIYEYIPNEDELFAHIMSFWDGSSENIPDALYDIFIENGISMDENKTMLIRPKDLYSKDNVSEYKLLVQEKSMQDLDSSVLFGDYSPYNEIEVLRAAESIPPKDLVISSLLCKELQCSLYVVVSTKDVLTQFSSLLSEVENAASVMTTSPVGDDNQAQIFLNFIKKE